MSDQSKGRGQEPRQNLQSNFFNEARRSGERVTIFLINGKKLTGRIRAFDRYTLLLDSGNSEEVIFKHAVSTVSQSTRAKSTRPRKDKGEKKRGDKKDSPQHKPTEQPLSHRMDLSSLQSATEDKQAEAAPAPTSTDDASAPADTAATAPTTENSPEKEPGATPEAD